MVRSAINTAVPPTASGKVSELPRPYAKNNLAAESITSLSFSPRVACAYSAAVSMRLECTCTVPLGTPVEPDEYSQKHGSSRSVGAASKTSVEAASTSRSQCMPAAGAAAEDTTTCFKKGDCSRIGWNCANSGSDMTSIGARLSCSMYA